MCEYEVHGPTLARRRATADDGTDERDVTVEVRYLYAPDGQLVAVSESAAAINALREGLNDMDELTARAAVLAIMATVPGPHGTMYQSV